MKSLPVPAVLLVLCAVVTVTSTTPGVSVDGEVAVIEVGLGGQAVAVGGVVLIFAG